MRIYQNIFVVKSEDLKWFINEITKQAAELQEKGFEVEFDYKPLMNHEQITYTCMVKAFN